MRIFYISFNLIHSQIQGMTIFSFILLFASSLVDCLFAVDKPFDLFLSYFTSFIVVAYDFGVISKKIIDMTNVKEIFSIFYSRNFSVLMLV